MRALLRSKVTSSAIDMGEIGHNFEKAAVWREDPLSVSFLFAAEVQHIPFLPLRGGAMPARQEADSLWDGTAAHPAAFFRFPFLFAFLDTNSSDAFCVFLPGLWMGGILSCACEARLFVVFVLLLYLD